MTPDPLDALRRQLANPICKTIVPVVTSHTMGSAYNLLHWVGYVDHNISIVDSSGRPVPYDDGAVIISQTPSGGTTACPPLLITVTI